MNLGLTEKEVIVGAIKLRVLINTVKSELKTHGLDDKESLEVLKVLIREKQIACLVDVLDDIHKDMDNIRYAIDFIQR